MKDKIWISLMELGGRFGSHQLPERSFFVFGFQFPLCARCTGILTGELLSFSSALVGRLPRSLPFSVFLVLPTVVDGLTQLAGLQKSTNRRRFITGLLAGVGTIAIIKNLLCRRDSRS